ncbi:MAG TPA: hypothetical protein VLT62_02050 [Candidatus Methylomirabilis sp.]|nr:hypothetical protein [Candidatus Methylomirabilis sp.]
MITSDEARYIRSAAYVPEHSVGLMASISRGEPFLADSFPSFTGDDWVILVGYPLSGMFVPEDLSRAIAAIRQHRQPEYLWLVAPELPPAFASACRERESDRYYTLELSGFAPRHDLTRIVARAGRDVTVERGRRIGIDHDQVISEFLERQRPGPRIERLFLSMGGYTAASTDAVVLTARRKGGEVSAFYVVDLGAEKFATYVVGCHSRKHYVPGASDLLFAEMTALAREEGRGYIHLGLGVNEGIRRFKEKWGGVPGLPCEFCEHKQDRLARLFSLATRRWP